MAWVHGPLQDLGPRSPGEAGPWAGWGEEGIATHMAVGGRCCWPSRAFPRCQGTAAGRPAGLLELSGVLAGEGMVPPLLGTAGPRALCCPGSAPPGFWRAGAGAGEAQPGPASGGGAAGAGRPSQPRPGPSPGPVPGSPLQPPATARTKVAGPRPQVPQLGALSPAACLANLRNAFQSMNNRFPLPLSTSCPANTFTFDES